MKKSEMFHFKYFQIKRNCKKGFIKIESLKEVKKYKNKEKIYLLF